MYRLRTTPKVSRIQIPVCSPHTVRISYPAQGRQFFTLPNLPGSTPTHLKESRLLPHSASDLCRLIASIDAYSSFVPFCTASRITAWSAPDDQGVRWPARAALDVAFSGYKETFVSRVYCVPGKEVEAVAGEARTSLADQELEIYTNDKVKGSVPRPRENAENTSGTDAVFKTLRTRWSFKPFHFKPPPVDADPRTQKALEPAQPRTEVLLEMEFQFANPVYAALSSAVAPKVAGVMIEAFEKRANEVLG